MAREKPATIVVFLEDGTPESHDLASDRDWSVIFEDVLEIKGREATTYYPLDAVRKWCVHAQGRAVSPPDKSASLIVERYESKARS